MPVHRRPRRTIVAMSPLTPPPVPKIVNETVIRIAAAKGFKKPRLHVESGSSAEDGYSSLVFRVTVRDEYQPSCCLSSGSGGMDDLVLIVKVPDQQSNNTFTKLVFASESSMYKSVLPALQDVAHFKGTLPWPKCFHASADGPNTSLVFEDLRQEGFVMANRRVAMSVEHCRLALSQLAKFHGAGIALHHLKPDTFKALTESLQNPFSHPDMQAMFGQMSQMVGQTMAYVTEKYPEGTDVNIKLQQILQSFGTEGMKLMSAAPGQAPGNAVVHGDCHVNNMMFRYDQGGAAVACRLIDFQMSRAGSTAMDLASLLLPCTEKSMRDKHWDELLRGYHTELQNTLRSAGCEDPDAVYSWVQFMECLKKASVYGFIIAPILLHAHFADKQAAEEFREMLHDMGKMTEQPVSFSINDTDQLKQRLTDIVESLVDWDWL